MICYFQVDRVYLRCPSVIAVLDHERKRTFVLKKEGLSDVGKLPYVLACMPHTAMEKNWKILYLCMS